MIHDPTLEELVLFLPFLKPVNIDTIYIHPPYRLHHAI